MLSFHEEYESEDGLGITRNKQIVNEDGNFKQTIANNHAKSSTINRDSCAEDSDSDKTRGMYLHMIIDFLRTFFYQHYYTSCNTG